MRNNEIFLFSCWFTALVWTLRSRALDVELNKLDWNSSNAGSIPISSSKPVHPVGGKKNKNGRNALNTTVSVLQSYLLTSSLAYPIFLLYWYMSSSPRKPKQGVKRPKTKTFDILELFLNWQRKITVATNSRVLLQWRPAASWVVLSVRDSFLIQECHIPG